RSTRLTGTFTPGGLGPPGVRTNGETAPGIGPPWAAVGLQSRPRPRDGERAEFRLPRQQTVPDRGGETRPPRLPLGPDARRQARGDDVPDQPAWACSSAVGATTRSGAGRPTTS